MKLLFVLFLLTSFATQTWAQDGVSSTDAKTFAEWNQDSLETTRQIIQVYEASKRGDKVLAKKIYDHVFFVKKAWPAGRVNGPLSPHALIFEDKTVEAQAQEILVSRLGSAAMSGRTEEVNAIVSMPGFKINKVDSVDLDLGLVERTRGQTALHLAARTDQTWKNLKISEASYARLVSDGSRNSMRLMLAHGADPNVVDAEGDTPLHVAAAAGDLVKVKLLIRAGANPKIKNKLGKDVIHASTDPDVISFLAVLIAHQSTGTTPKPSLDSTIGD